jgi:hypothetical protein
MIPFFPPPDRTRGLYILASSVLHYGYYFFLLRAYRFGDLGPVNARVSRAMPND